jgi:hypothetical protein
LSQPVLSAYSPIKYEISDIQGSQDAQCQDYGHLLRGEV